jgi:Ras-related protein Rab-1A
MSQHDFLFKLLIVGESGVGKTCMLLRFADNQFEENFLSTIGVDFKVRELDVDGKRVKLQIWDSAGQERFRNITTSYYRNCGGIIIVYDITRHDTFVKVTEWIEEVRKNTNNVPLLLVGNKADLEDKRQVDEAEAKELADRMGLVLLETSAKTSQNIEGAFKAISKQLMDDAINKPKAEPGKQPILNKKKNAGKSCC